MVSILVTRGRFVDFSDFEAQVDLLAPQGIDLI